jgi:hypothetical protein
VLVLTALCITVLACSYTKVKAAVEEGVAGISTKLNDLTDKDIKQMLSITYLWTTTDKVNFRTEDNINSDVILQLDKRSKVQKILSCGEWTKVYFDGQIGYVYSKYLRNTELPSLNFTDEEIDLIAKIVWLESRNQSDSGEAAVVLVIRNRILSTAFSDTVYEVLSDTNQFTTWKLIDKASPEEREYEIIEECLLGEWDYLLDEDYFYFSTSPRNDNGTIKIGDHYFCQYD